jgi:large subunit ribosomal protein L30e
MDIERNLKIAIDTGKVLFGTKEAEKALKSKTAKAIVVAKNCSNELILNQKTTKLHWFPGDNVALGALCGKPFSISAVTIINPGESGIMSG